MDQRTPPGRRYSRRDFLKGLPIGVAGAFAVSMVVGRLPSFLARRRRPPVFREGSIFTPSADSRRDG